MKKYDLLQVLSLMMIILICGGCSQRDPVSPKPVEPGLVEDSAQVDSDLVVVADPQTTALIHLLSAEPLGVNEELIEAFYDYLPHETELALLPDFGAGQAVNWDELTLFIFEEYQALFPAEATLQRELTQGEFKQMVNRLLKDVTYTDQSSLYLSYEENKYICGNFDVGGSTDYRLTDLEKDEQGIYTATFDRLLFYEGETHDLEESKNIKTIYDSIGATEPLQNHDFNPALLNIFKQDDYAQILDMTGTITIVFTLSGDPIYPFTYHSCTRTLYEDQEDAYSE